MGQMWYCDSYMSDPGENALTPYKASDPKIKHLTCQFHIEALYYYNEGHGRW